jgi:hypothetical protein
MNKQHQAEIIAKSQEEAHKRANMKPAIINPGESVSGTYKGTTEYPKRQYCTTAIVLEKLEGDYVTYPMNDWLKVQLSVQNAIVDKSIVTILNNGVVKVDGGNDYHRQTVVVKDLS